jgi:glutamine synthetase
MTPDDFFALAKKHEAEMVDLKFVDMLGSWQHCSFPIDHLDKARSRRAWVRRLVDPRLDGHPRVRHAGRPGRRHGAPRSVLSRGRRQRDREHRRSVTGKRSQRDPRTSRARPSSTEESGIADTCYIGPEPEFFIFDEVRYEQNQHRGYYEIDSVGRRVEHGPNRGAEPRLQAKLQGRLLPGEPTDTYHDLRGEMVYEMRKIGSSSKRITRVATAGQSEIDHASSSRC